MKQTGGQGSASKDLSRKSDQIEGVRALHLVENPAISSQVSLSKFSRTLTFLLPGGCRIFGLHMGVPHQAAGLHGSSYSHRVQ